MQNYHDRIVFYACIIFIGLVAFASGVITAAGIIILIWRAFT